MILGNVDHFWVFSSSLRRSQLSVQNFFVLFLGHLDRKLQSELSTFKSAYTITGLVNFVITDRLLNTLALFTILGVIKGVVINIRQCLHYPSVFVLIKPFPTAAAAGRQAEMYIMDTEHFSRVDTKAVSVLMTNSVNCKPQTGRDQE